MAQSENQMDFRSRPFRLHPLWALSLLIGLVLGLSSQFVPSQASAATADPQFEQVVTPFFRQNCVKCHNVDNSTAGVRVDTLDPAFRDEQIKAWEAIRHRISTGTMPPKGMPQPSAAERQQIAEWIG